MSAGNGERLAYIIDALRRHERFTRANGGTVPAGMNELVDSMIFDRIDASRRQDPTSLEQAPALRELEPVAVSYETAARLLEVSHRQVQRLVRAGDLKAVALGGSRRIPLQQLKKIAQEDDP